MHEDMGDQEPRRIGHYEIRGEIGRGAMAVVYRAYDPELEREVAIKEPQIAAGMPKSERESLIARFEVEAKAAARLSHPGVVAVYSTVRQDDRLYIVMELLSGMTLTERRAAGWIPPDEAARITWEIASALAYAHSKGVIHRDVKPDNVFILDDGHVKLGDFGVARLGVSSQFTHAGTILGTPGYMSPEQVLGRPADARSDIFSLGVLFETLLTGVNPYGADSGTEFSSVMYRIVHEDIPPIGAGTARPDIDPAYEAMIMKATAKNPDYRYAHASEMVADIATRHAPDPLPPEASHFPDEGAVPAPAGDAAVATAGTPPPGTLAAGASDIQPAAAPAGTVIAGAASVPVEAAPGAEAPVAARSRTGLWVIGGIGATLAGLLFVAAVALAVIFWHPWSTSDGTTGPGGLDTGAATSTPSTTQPPNTGGDQNAAARRQYLAGAAAISDGLIGAAADLRSTSDRINSALSGSSSGEISAARSRLDVISEKIARLRSSLVSDPTGSYGGIDAKLSRLLELADTRVSSQKAICDAYMNGARGANLTGAGQPWGHQARIEFERVQAQLAQQLSAAQAASP